MDCLFCKIIKGEIPCYKIYEDENTFAFLDIAQEGYGHTIVVPKKHSSCMMETDDITFMQCMKTVKKIAKHYIDDCGFEGFNLFINNGECSGQSINHLHIHIIPRKQFDGFGIWHMPNLNDNLQDVCEKLAFKDEILSDLSEKYILYTDGACSGNPGIGGFSAIIKNGDSEKIITGGDPETTNNKMELMGVIKGLENIPEGSTVEIYSDSAYVVNAFSLNWINNWMANNWLTKSGSSVANIDLWKRLLQLTQNHDIIWNKVKGHSDNPLNNKCDELAKGEIDKIRAMK